MRHVKTHRFQFAHASELNGYLRELTRQTVAQRLFDVH